MTKEKIILFSIFFCVSSLFGFIKDNGSVDHKNADISGYLNEISEEQEEKTQILKHILAKNCGTYVDLGTGGDSIAYLLENIPNHVPVTLIGSDIDQSILNSIPQRHPEILPYLDEKENETLHLKLVRMDATNMHPLHQSSIDGISASALTHEIFSYVPTKSSLDQFFIELIRVLKKDGIFVYRDPKWDDNPEQDCLVILKDYTAKLFTVLFLPRFLETKFSERKDYTGKCIKPNLYHKSYIKINFFFKGSEKTSKVKLDSFINTPLSEIDLTKNISIEAPRGLISEIQRHYILFLKNIFITDLVDKHFFEKDIISLEQLPLQEKIILKNFLNKRVETERLIDTSLPIFQKIFLEKKYFSSFVENGLWAKIIDKTALIHCCNTLFAKGIHKNLLVIENDKVWLDAKLAILLYQNFKSGIYACIDISESKVPLQVFEWLKREGEEFYFYKTTDNFVKYVGQLTLYYLKGTDKDGYLLCPLDAASITTVSRDLYRSIVKNHMDVINLDGKQQKIIFDKNIIHFKLMKKEDALAVYQEIIKQNPKSFPQLKEWVKHELM
jgi:SAM-dependent methyltransferase